MATSCLKITSGISVRIKSHRLLGKDLFLKDIGCVCVAQDKQLLSCESNMLVYLLSLTLNCYQLQNRCWRSLVKYLEVKNWDALILFYFMNEY